MQPVLNIKLHLFILVSYFTGGIFYAQNDVKSEVLKINQTFLSLQKYSMDIEHVYYIDGSKEKVVSQNKSTYKRNGDMIYIKQLHTETVLNKKYAINIDSRNKYIILSYRNHTSNKKEIDANDMLIRLDSILTIYETTNLDKKENGVNEITFGFKKGSAVKSITVNYNSKTYIINSVKANYTKAIEQGGKKYIASEIVYRNFNLNPVFEKGIFSESSFVNITKNQIIGTGAFSNYQVINKLTKKR